MVMTTNWAPFCVLIDSVQEQYLPQVVVKVSITRIVFQFFGISTCLGLFGSYVLALFSCCRVKNNPNAAFINNLFVVFKLELCD